MKRICDDNLKCQPGFDCNSFFADTCLILTPHYYGQFALSLGKQSLYIFSYFNLMNTDTFYGSLSVCVKGGLLLGHCYDKGKFKCTEKKLFAFSPQG